MKTKPTFPGSILIFLIICIPLTGCTNRQVVVDPGPDPELMSMKRELSASIERISTLEKRLDRLEVRVKSDKKDVPRKDPRGKVKAETEKKPSPDVKAAPPEVEAAPSEVKAAPPEVEPRPGSAEGLYNQALAQYKREEYSKALAGFNTFLESYPRDDLADNAVYWKGECYYSRKEYRRAIDSFKKIISEYPEGGKIPDTYLKIAYSYKQLNDIPSTRIFLKKVIKNYPFSPSGIKAEAMLKSLDK